MKWTEMDPQPLTPPRIYLVRMAVFLVLSGFVAFILHRQIWAAFLANPGLNARVDGVARAPGTDGSPDREPVEPFLALGRDHALAPRLGRGPPRRKPRNRSLSRRAPGLSRPARDLLGPHRNRGIGRTHHRLAANRTGRGRALRRVEERSLGPAPRHGSLVLGLAFRSLGLARGRLSRPSGWPGAEPVLHGTGGLARHFDRRYDDRHDAPAHRHALRSRRGSQPLDDRGERRRRWAGCDASHGPPRRGHPGPRSAHAFGTADDPGLGRSPGRAGKGAQAGLGPSRSRENFMTCPSGDCP